MRRVTVVRLLLIFLILFYFLLQFWLHSSNPLAHGAGPGSVVELPLAREPEAPRPLPTLPLDVKGETPNGDATPHASEAPSDPPGEPTPDSSPSSASNDSPSEATPKPEPPKPVIINGCQRTAWDEVVLTAFREGSIVGFRPRKADSEQKGRAAEDYCPDGDVLVADEPDSRIVVKQQSGAELRGEEQDRKAKFFTFPGDEKEETSPLEVASECIAPVNVRAAYQDQQFAVTFPNKRDGKARLPRVTLRLEGGTSNTLSIVVDTNGNQLVDFFGLAMRGNSLFLPKGRNPIRVKNLDLNHYDASDATLGLYGSIPLVYATVHEARPQATDENDATATGSSAPFTFGVLWLNGSPAHVEVGSDTLTFTGSAGGVRFFLLAGPTPADVLRQYFHLTDRPPLPPMFSIGYQQCRWSYNDQRDVETVSSNFDSRDLPCDAIWLDIDHTDRKHYFTWDRSKYPEPIEMQNKLWNSAGRRMVTITDPHISRDPGYFVFREAQEKGFFIRDESGARDFEGHCWPGASSWVDFSNPKAREWYATLFKYDRYEQSTEHLYSWLDMNEPSVFSGPETTMPMTALHEGGLRHEVIHNLYGFYHTMAAFQGHLTRSEGKQRPFMLTRSFYAGSQRYTAVWNGDNQARWSHLTASVSHILQMTACGLPFVGADVGGFFDDPEDQLIVRWYQLGSLYPFFRGHSHEQTRRREPWLFTQNVVLKIAAALRFRYQLMPYLYTTFWELSDSDRANQAFSGPNSTVRAEGVFQPLMMRYPWDFKAYRVEDTFLLGSALIARPLYEVKGSFELFLPKREASGGSELERVYDFWTGKQLWGPAAAALQTKKNSQRLSLLEDERFVVPLFIIAGRIVPMKVHHAASTERLTSVPFKLVIGPDPDGNGEGHVYLDDGVTTSHSQFSESCLVRFEFRASTLKAFVNPSECELPQADKECPWCKPILAEVLLYGQTRLIASGLISVVKRDKTTGKAGPEEKVPPKPFDKGDGSTVFLDELDLPLVPTREELDGVKNKEKPMTLWKLRFGVPYA
jgi:alpha-glucosidase (family GH31 glycosyl hydrolase)